MTPTDSVTLQTCTVRAAPAGLLLEAGQLLAAAFAWAFPEDPPMFPEQIASELSLQLSDQEKWVAALRVQGQLVGWASLHWSRTQNSHLGQVTLVVRPGQRRRGHGSQLFAAVRGLAQQAGLTHLTGWATDRVPAGEAFVTRLGATPALPMLTSQLDLTALDAARLAAWQQRPAAEPYRLRQYGTVIAPEEYPRLARAFMLMNDAPRGDLEVADEIVTPEMVAEWQTMLAAEGEERRLLAAEATGGEQAGELVAYTELFWHPQRATLVYQGATVVHPAHRGQGLAKWIKAATLDLLTRDNPQARYVRTGNAHSNAGMLEINRALGFLPFANRTEWQLNLSAQ